MNNCFFTFNHLALKNHDELVGTCYVQVFVQPYTKTGPSAFTNASRDYN